MPKGRTDRRRQRNYHWFASARFINYKGNLILSHKNTLVYIGFKFCFSRITLSTETKHNIILWSKFIMKIFKEVLFIKNSLMVISKSFENNQCVIRNCTSFFSFSKILSSLLKHHLAWLNILLKLTDFWVTLSLPSKSICSSSWLKNHPSGNFNFSLQIPFK